MNVAKLRSLLQPFPDEMEVRVAVGPPDVQLSVVSVASSSDAIAYGFAVVMAEAEPTLDTALEDVPAPASPS